MPINAGAQVTASVTAGAQVAASVSSSAAVDVDIGTQVYRSQPLYTGAYEATPTQSTQVLSTAGYAMAADFVVNPIPSNYGLITYNGSTLTVS